jgi:THO complex subunit 5
MTVDSMITDPSLQPLLKAMQAALAQSQATLEWLEEHAASGKPSRDMQVELARQQRTLHVCLAKMRKVHRQATYRVRDIKQETTNARQEVDRLLLQVQNLSYEQKHLEGEIDACESYGHSHAELPLIDEDEYKGRHPDDDGLPDEELMPKRIEYEKEERQRLEGERLELVKIKQKLVDENKKKRDELQKMDDKLEGMIKGLDPLREALLKGPSSMTEANGTSLKV